MRNVMWSARMSHNKLGSRRRRFGEKGRKNNNEPPDEIVDSIRVKKLLHFRIQRRRQRKNNLRLCVVRVEIKLDAMEGGLCVRAT